MGNDVIVVNNSKSVNASELVNIIFKRIVIVVSVLVATVALVVVAVCLIPPTYNAQSTVIVKMGREYLSRPEVGDKSTVMAMSQDAIVNTELQILSSRELIEKVIAAMKVENIYPDIARNPPENMSPVNAAAMRFEKGVSVSRVRNSNVIQVTFQHDNPATAVQAVNLLVDFFKEKHLKVFSDPQSSFIEQQLQVYQQKFIDSQNNLESFKQANRVFSIDEQRSLLLKQQMDLDTSLKVSTNGVVELQNKVTTLRNQLKNISDTESNNSNNDTDSIISEAKSKLLTLQLNEQELLKKYTETNRFVVNARKETELVSNFIKEHEAQLNARRKAGSPLYQDIRRELLRSETELNSMMARVSSLKGQLISVRKEISQINMTEQRLENLKRDKSITEKNLQSYQDRAEESRLSDEMDRLKLANIGVIQPAALPLMPAETNKMKIVMIGVIGGMVLAVGAALFTEKVSRQYLTPDNVEKQLGVPVLISIPYNKG